MASSVAMEPKNVILRPNWNLLDSTFESYKLSLQQLPVYTIDPGCKPDTVTLSGEEFSFNRTKAVSMHNYLFGDPWDDRSCYFVDDTGGVRCLSVIFEGSVAPPKTMFQLGSHFLRSGRRTPVTLSFPSPTHCLISDGAGLVYLVDTGSRQSNGGTKWKAIFNEEIVGGAQSPVMLLDSKYFQKYCQGDDCEDQDMIGLLSLRFEDEKKNSVVATISITDWTCLVRSRSGNEYRVEDRHTIKGKQVPFYAALGESGTEIFLGCHSKLRFESDWDHEALEGMDIDTAKYIKDSSYTWSQSADDVSVQIPLPEGYDKSSVEFALSKTAIKVGFKGPDENTTTILDGELFSEVDIEMSSWSIADDTLEVTIHKQQDSSWPCVVLGDTCGNLLDSDKQSSGAEMDGLEVRGIQPTGLDRYEDCDDLQDANSTLYCFSSVSNKFTHESSIAGNQWIFNCYQDNKFCTVLRHDVDALVWRSDIPTETSANPWTHIATFNALGYVRASKEDVKYGGCSPNATYSALCESNRRVFVYHSPTISAAPLRNRSTGKQMHISKQQVVTLPSSDPIIGFHAASELMFILTEQKLFVVKVNAPDT